jgi:hypothetical protein
MPTTSRRRVLAALGGVVAGTSLATADGDADDSTGGWQREVDGEADDATVDLAVAPDGGVVALVAARSEAGDPILARFDADGTPRWRRRYETDRRDLPAALVPTATGYAVVGTDHTADLPWLLAVDREGRRRRWRRYADLGGPAQATALARRPDGGFVLAGHVDPGFEERTWLLGVDADGRPAWDRRLPPETAWVEDVAVRPDGRLLVAGHAHVGTAGGGYAVDAVVHGLDAEGNARWHRTFGGAGQDRLAAVLARPYGALVAGTTSSTDPAGTVLAALDGRGRPVWRRTAPDAAAVDLADLRGGALVGRRDGVLAVDRYGQVRWRRAAAGADLGAVAVVGSTVVTGGETPYRGGERKSAAWVAGAPFGGEADT